MSAKPTGGKPPFDRSGGGPRGGRGPSGRGRKGPAASGAKGSGRFEETPRGRDKPPRREGSLPWQREERPQGKGEDYADRSPRREDSDRPPRRGDDRGAPPRRDQYDDRPPRRDERDYEASPRREAYFEPSERPRRPSYRADVAGPAVVPPPEYKPEELAKTAEKVTAACLEVHRQLGSALDVTTYQRALALEMQNRSLAFEREERVPVSYKGRQIDTRKVDFIVGGCLVELRSQASLSAEDILRIGNYLKASGYRMTLLVNFGPPKIEARSLIHEAKEG